MLLIRSRSAQSRPLGLRSLVRLPAACPRRTAPHRSAIPLLPILPELQRAIVRPKEGARAAGRVSLPPEDLIDQLIAQFHPADRVLTLAKLLVGLQEPRSDLLQPFALGWRALSLTRRVAIVGTHAKNRRFRPAVLVSRAPKLPPSDLRLVQPFALGWRALNLT